jgi:hypothetical protein
MKLAKLSSKIILCVLTILFWGVAAGLSYIGANIFMTYERYGDLFTYLHSVVPAFILIGAAFLMFLIGVIGICALFSENRCLLGIYFTLLFSLLALEVAGVVLAIVYQTTVKGYVKNLFSDVLENYGTMNETRMTQNFDYIQYKLQCCGETNFTDWERTWWYANANDRIGNVPQSCCSNFRMRLDEDNALTNTLGRSSVISTTKYCTATSPVPNNLDNYYQEGCYKKLEHIIRGRFFYIAAIFVALILIQFTGLIATCVLMCCRNIKGNQRPPYSHIATHEEAQYNL